MRLSTTKEKNLITKNLNHNSKNSTKYEACPKSIRLYFFPEKPVMAGWQI
jgi:hypothetical protein